MQMTLMRKTSAAFQVLSTKGVKEWVFAGLLCGLNGPSVPLPVESAFLCAPGPSWTTWAARNAPILWLSRSKSVCSRTAPLPTLWHLMPCALPLPGVTGVPVAPPVALECESGRDCLPGNRPRSRNVNVVLWWTSRRSALSAPTASLQGKMPKRSARTTLTRVLAEAASCGMHSTRPLGTVRPSPTAVVVATGTTLSTVRIVWKPARTSVNFGRQPLKWWNNRLWIVNCPNGRLGLPAQEVVIMVSPRSTGRLWGNRRTEDRRVVPQSAAEGVTCRNVNKSYWI